MIYHYTSGFQCKILGKHWLGHIITHLETYFLHSLCLTVMSCAWQRSPTPSNLLQCLVMEGQGVLRFLDPGIQSAWTLIWIGLFFKLGAVQAFLLEYCNVYRAYKFQVIDSLGHWQQMASNGRHKRDIRVSHNRLIYLHKLLLWKLMDLFCNPLDRKWA